jgi:Tfp pilus assembly protein PilN/RNase H-fold protein (predicted Holliday junction resolvase)
VNVPRLLGVDFDSRKVRMAASEVRFRTVRHLKSEELILAGNKEERAAALSEALQGWKKKYSPDGVVIGLPLQHFSVRLLEMPTMARDDMRRALQFEMEKHLPLPVDEYVFDFLTSKGRKGYRALVFSIRKDTVHALHKTMSDAGMAVVSIRCRTIDLLNSMAEISHDKQMNGVFVHAADDDYELAAIEDAGVVSVKRIPKQHDLANEVELALQQYPGKVYASGEFEQLMLERFTARKAQIFSSYALLSSFAKKQRFSLEFIPPELAGQKKDFYPYAIAGCAVAAIAFFLLTGFVAYLKDAYALNSIEAQINAIKTKASGVIETRKKLDALQDDRRVLVDFLDRSNRAVKAMRDLSQTVPSDTWIINLSLDDKGNIEVEGFSRKTSDLVLTLEKSGRFKSIAFAAPIISREGEERFSLKLEVKD